MSTRAVYRFIDASVTAPNDHFQVYIHSDGYPSYAWHYFDNVFQAKVTWELPRFEADEFAAGFIAANKDAEGGVRCLNAGNKNLPSDIEYLYVLQPGVVAGGIGAGNLQLTIYSVNNWEKLKKTQLWQGTVQQFIAEKGAFCEKEET